MRVLFCSNEMSFTGAPLILLDVVRGLKERGLVVPAVHCQTGGPLAGRFEAIGVPVVPFVDWKSFDLIYVNTVVNYRLIRTAAEKGIPSLWAIHESQPALHYADQKHLVELLKCLRLPKKVIFQSHCTANVYGRYSPGHNFAVVPGAVAVPTGPSRDEARKSLGLTTELAVLTVGTIEKRKGQEDVAAAMWNTTKPLRWFLVGRKVDDIPMDPRMVVVEPTEDVWRYYRAADVYACTSRVESYPRTILEAVACGLPIVTTPVYGIKEQVGGVFYKPGDTQDLWEKVERHESVRHPKHWSLGEMVEAYSAMVSN